MDRVRAQNYTAPDTLSTCQPNEPSSSSSVACLIFTSTPTLRPHRRLPYSSSRPKTPAAVPSPSNPNNASLIPLSAPPTPLSGTWTTWKDSSSYHGTGKWPLKLRPATPCLLSMTRAKHVAHWTSVYRRHTTVHVIQRLDCHRLRRHLEQS